MRTRTTSDKPDATADGQVVERQVETVRTTESGTGVRADALPASQAVSGGRIGDYFETLPERLSAVGLVILTVIEGLLGMRFLLHAFGANPNSGFVGFIDDVSWAFARPFADVFSSRSWSEGIIEVSTLVAMGFYLVLFAILGMLVTALAPRLKDRPSGAA